MKLLRGLALMVSLIFSINSQAENAKIGILVFDGFLTSDVTAPIEVFGAATKKSWFSSYDVVLISAGEQKTVTSEEGLTVVANNNINDSPALDVLIVPSAYNMKPFLRDTKLIAFIKQQGTQTKWLASNCSGAFLLAKAGLLDGKKATTWAGGEKKLAKAYPNIDVQVDQNVVIDADVISSNGGPVSYQGAFELLAQLSSQKFADEIATSIQFDRLATAFK